MIPHLVVFSGAKPDVMGYNSAMPELPEVEHIARSLGAQIVGRRIIAVTHLDWERMIESPLVADFCALLAGRSIEATGRRAKWLLVTLDGGWTLALHLRMSGYLSIECVPYVPDIHTHLVIHIDDQRFICFHDARKFGRARLLDARGLAALDAAHGVEPLSDDFTADRLRGLLAQRSMRLKPCLLDQRIIAGIGNIYADEALWDAQLHPLRASNSLDNDEVVRLHTSIVRALRQGIEHGGSTLQDYRNSYGQPGNHQKYFNVYDRQGQPCQRCGTAIAWFRVHQRGTHLCTQCQRLTPIAEEKR